MSALRTYLDSKIQQGEKLLSIYLTAGFPTLAGTVPLLETISEAGADLIELGVPFSDPLADGPTIQHASQVALQNGITFSKILDMLREFRQRRDTPVLLMGYANTFVRRGWEGTAEAARSAGASGFIIPDLPLEESDGVLEALRQRELDLIPLAAPNTPAERLEQIDRQAGAFIYAVSLTGVTGARERLPEDTRTFLQELRRRTSQPVLVGFGISGADAARALSPFCDGVIVGSAVIQQIDQSDDLAAARQAVARLVEEIKTALSR